LRWLYGGPQEQRAILLGWRLDGRLVGFKAFLSRDLLIQGAFQRGCLNTHLAIDPGLHVLDRVRIVRDSTLAPWRPETFGRSIDVAYALFEADKPIVGPAERLLTSQGIEVAAGHFAQAVVGAPTSRIAARRADVGDIATIAALRQAIPSDVKVEFSLDHLAHHWFNAPEAEVYVVDDGDRARGAIAVYRLDVLKTGRKTTIAICEQLLAETSEIACALLAAATGYRRRIEARGVVCENATYLPAEAQRACQIIPSARTMRISVMSRRAQSIGAKWMVGVK